MEDFSVLLQAKLNQLESEKNINSDLVAITKAIEKLKVQAEIDPNSVKHIVQQLANIMNQKVVVDNIQIDANKVSKSGTQAAQSFGNSFSKNLQSNLNTVKSNIENTIKGFSNQKLNSYDLSKMFNLNRVDIDGSVIHQVRSLTNELNSLAKEALKTNSDSSWEGIVNKISSLSNVLSKFGSGRDLSAFKESLDILDYFQNKKIFVGDKSEAIANTGLSVKELNNQFRNLGVTFTTVSNGAIKLDTIWSELFNLSPNLQNFDTIGDQLNAIVKHFKIAKEALYGDSNLQPLNGGEVNKVLLDWLSNLENASKKVNVFREEQSELEKQIAQASTSATNTIVQNEEKKQQAYRETAQTQKQISESESLVKSGANVRTYEHTNNAAREALNDFRELLKEENAVISVSEKFGNLNGLTSFTVNVKRATGEVESLRYALKPIVDGNGNDTGEFYFSNVGAEINNSGAIKQIQSIENAFADYTQKLAQFKSTNSEILSGLSAPISDFESKLSGLKNGTSTIDEVVNSYKSLNTEASKITENFSRQLSPIDSAIRKLASGEETIAGLRAEIKGLDNAPKELNSELNKCASILENVKKIEAEQGRSADWSKAYRQWSDFLDVIQSKLKTLKKEQSNVASTQIFNTSDLKADNIAYITKVYNTIEKQMASIQSMARGKGWEVVDVSGVEQADGKIKQLTLTIKDAEGALKKLTMQREKLQGNGKAQYGLMQVGDVKVIETATQAQEKLAQSAEKANAKLAQQANKIQLSMDNGHGISQYQNRIKGLINDFEKYGVATDKAEAETKSLQQIFNSMKGLSGHGLVEQAKKFEQEYKAVKISIENTKLSYDKLMQPVSDEKISSLIVKINSFLKSNTAITQEAKILLESYISELSGRNINIQKWTSINNEFIKIKANMSILDKLGKTLTDQFMQAVGTLSQYFSIARVLSAILNQLQKMPQAVYEIDTAMTNLYKVTDETDKKYSQFLASASTSAYKLGRSISSLVEQTANWAKLGFSIDEATKLAEISSIYANVGEVDDDTAVSDIITAMKAFNIEAKDSIVIVDSLNKLGNEFATDAKSLGEGLRNAASSMAVAGNDINQTLAILTGGGEITQNVGELSNGLRVVSMRLRGMKGELQAIGEEYEDIESISKIQTQIYNLTNGSVNIFKDDGSFKSTYEQLKEISEIYFDLNDSDRASLTEIMFGKNRANQGIAILQAFKSGQVQKAYEASTNAVGSAMQEQERWLGSLEAKTKQFEAAFQSLSQTVLDSDLLKGFVELGTTGVSALEGLAKILETINSFGGNLNGIFSSMGAISGILMNKAGIGECTMFQWQLYCAHPSKAIYNAI